MFLGIDFFSGLLAMTPPYTQTDTVDKLTLKTGTYDKMYLSTNPNEYEVDDEVFDFDTKLMADFEENLEAGNSAFSLKNTDTVVIKCREKGTMDWITIYTVPINKIEDFEINKLYPFAANRTEYEFSIASVQNGAENAYTTTEVESKFDGVCIADAKNFYSTDIDVESVNITQNISNAVLPLLNNTFPVIVSNDDSNYSSGDVTAVFMEIGEDCMPITDITAKRYREQIMKFLTNKKAKILKLGDGTVKMIQVTGTPSINDAGHPDLKNLSFSWTEIGDIQSEKDLYRSGLSNVEPGRY